MLHVITWEEAKARLLGRLEPLAETERVTLTDALGRTLVQEVRASEDIPSGDRSMVDGYAVRAADTNGASEAIPALLICVGEVAMGENPTLSLQQGQCCRIWTGGFLPQGADAAVMIEHTEPLGDGTICVSRPAAPGSHLVFRGDEMGRDQVMLAAGTMLGSCEIGTLAAMGVTELTVRRRPVVGILSTGDELVEPSESPKPGQMRDVNRPMLRACVTQAGGLVLDFGIRLDSWDGLRDCLSEAVERCDMVVMSGGTSAGARDYAPSIFSELGELLWHGLAVKPGKPTLSAMVQGKPVLGLPGHPAAACMIWQLLGLPAVDALLGRTRPDLSRKAVLTEPVSANDGRAQLLPVRLEGERAVPIRSKSGIISQLLWADGFVVIDRNREGVAAGKAVTVHGFYGR